MQLIYVCIMSRGLGSVRFSEQATTTKIPVTIFPSLYHNGKTERERKKNNNEYLMLEFFPVRNNN